MLTEHEFGAIFDDFEHTAFRLEVRDRYDEPYENESLRRFLAGEPDDLPWMQEWLDLVRAATSEGRQFRRVRVVSLPLTGYSRFGVWCAQVTNAAGEDIRYLPRDRAEVIGLPQHDYWLFDSRTLVRMSIDDDDRFLGAERIDEPTAVVQANYWRDAAWHHAMTRDHFANEQNLGRRERP